jgi:hypothetical protein
VSAYIPLAWSDDATVIIGLTPVGRATIGALRMNRSQMIGCAVCGTLWVNTLHMQSSDLAATAAASGPVPDRLHFLSFSALGDSGHCKLDSAPRFPCSRLTLPCVSSHSVERGQLAGNGRALDRRSRSWMGRCRKPIYPFFPFPTLSITGLLLKSSFAFNSNPLSVTRYSNGPLPDGSLTFLS